MKKNAKKGLFLLIFLSTLLLSSFIGLEFGIYGINPQKNSDIFEEVIPQPANDQSLIYGTMNSPIDMDPHLCYDFASMQVIEQVCEGLYKFDVTDPSAPLVSVLAEDLPTLEGTLEKPELLIDIEKNVYFSDGSPFIADAVKWNFDRLNYFLNYSGNKYLPAPFNVPLPSDGSIQVTKVYNLFTSGGIPIINETIAENTYTVRIKMNFPKASFYNLLASHSAFFHSPISARTQGKELDYLTYADGEVLIGTGPFIFQNYYTNIQMNFIGNPNYWQGAPKLESLTFKIIGNNIVLNEAVLDGIIDLCCTPLPDFFPEFEANPDITLLEAGPTVGISYMGFNGYMVNTNFRKAISYAIDYSYIIDTIYQGQAYRLKSPIPAGIPMSNYGFDYPVFNREYAQSIMQDMGYGVGFTTDEEWLEKAESGGWEVTKNWNITFNSESPTRRMIAPYISENLRYLGINAPVVEIPFWDLITCMENDVGSLRRDKIPMYLLGWNFDYIDPENYITPLYNRSSSIWVNTYDEELEDLMLAGETTIDPFDRKQIYDQIQQKLVEELFFFVWIATGKNYDVYYNYVKGWVPNALNKVDFYPVYLEFEVEEDTTPPMILYDSIPDEIKITYTRSTQIIGSIKAVDSSNIMYVGWEALQSPDPGFSLITTYNEGEVDGNSMHFSETVVMTTNLLEPGIHELNLMIADEYVNIYVKSFTVEVYRLAELKLSGEFDYLEKEKIKISIAAQVLDLEEKFPMNPTSGIDFTVNIRIVDQSGIIKVEDSMLYNSLGFFQWDSIFTIDQLKDFFPKGIYIVQGWVEFSDGSYYEGGNDVIQFHIDPPASGESNSWLVLEIFSLGGLITGSIALAFLFLQKRWQNIRSRRY
jgi:peptide/nickel transport system substrate-binding protein